MAASEEAGLGEVRVPQSPLGGLDLVPHREMGWDLHSLSVGPIEQGLVLQSYDVMDWDLRSLSVGPVDLLIEGGDWALQNCAAVDLDQGTLGSEQGYWKEVVLFHSSEE